MCFKISKFNDKDLIFQNQILDIQYFSGALLSNTFSFALLFTVYYSHFFFLQMYIQINYGKFYHNLKCVSGLVLY